MDFLKGVGIFVHAQIVIVYGYKGIYMSDFSTATSTGITGILLCERLYTGKTATLR